MKATDPFRFRAPLPEDGSAVWDLIKSCGPLDDNSMYCNLLQCDHFSDTCILAEDGEGVCGWISGYVLPNDPGTLFVWQVATSARARGQGLAKRMLTKLIDRPACEAVIRLQTTITRDNKASWALFTSFARHMAAPLSHEAHFKQEEHFDGNHDTEYMVTIGDFGALKAAA
ncbi:MAG: diaminobutyrate acetyltransferase [Alphaproteobacteria bacterium]|nr:diaminobutyrate acetyltransferase [Alphaproteobacteria bacterium]